MEAATHMVGSLPGLLHTKRTSSYSQCMPGSRDCAAQRPSRVHLQCARGNQPLASSRTSRVRCQASTAVHFTDNFDSTQQEQWQISRKLVEDLGFSPEEANDILAKSFGWSYSDYWGEEKQATVPEPETVSASLTVMKDIPGVDLSALVKKFPEVMGLTEKEIKYSLGTLDGTWGIAGKALKNVLMRNPQVLGYNIDCGGDCAGECTRCWVRF
ncbi:hypothetical protein M758_12G124300 [Ceratodon purpureus]|nr:hypothetical protein M758_12G124300 [Ceratodon purpureus]